MGRLRGRRQEGHPGLTRGSTASSRCATRNLLPWVPAARERGPGRRRGRGPGPDDSRPAAYRELCAAGRLSMRSPGRLELLVAVYAGAGHVGLRRREEKGFPEPVGALRGEPGHVDRDRAALATMTIGLSGGVTGITRGCVGHAVGRAYVPQPARAWSQVRTRAAARRRFAARPGAAGGGATTGAATPHRRGPGRLPRGRSTTPYSSQRRGCVFCHTAPRAANCCELYKSWT